MKDPTVSVIIPAFNYARFLPDALDSVLCQSFGDWECIVIDDGSMDATPLVAAGYAARDARIRVLQQKNQGPSAARNLGLRQSRGRLVQFLDADDRLLPEKLTLHVEYLDSNPQTAIVYSEVGFFRSERPELLMPSLHGRLSASIMGRVHGVDEARKTLEHYNIMSTVAALIRREVFSITGLFDEGAVGCEDYDLWIRAAAAGFRFDYCETLQPLAAVRAHPGSTSRDFLRMLRGRIHIAHSFSTSEFARRWTEGRLPLIHEVMLGVDHAARGARFRGFRRITRAARAAAQPLTAWRWRIYAIAALTLPSWLFLRLVALPVPEWPFEVYRQIRTLFRSRSAGVSAPSAGADGEGS